MRTAEGERPTWSIRDALAAFAFAIVMSTILSGILLILIGEDGGGDEGAQRGFRPHHE